MCGSSFLWTCLWGGCSKIIVMHTELCLRHSGLSKDPDVDNLTLASAEDRATQGCDPSAD